MMYHSSISVRSLVESILTRGDLGVEGTFLSIERAQEGSRVHRIHQAMRQEESSTYEKEVYLKYCFILDDMEVTVDGRADGVESGKYIEEIKSTYKNLDDLNEDFNELHWAQVKFYGYMFMMENELNSIDLILTYYRIDTDEFISFSRTYTISELEEFTKEVLKVYVRLMKLRFTWQKYRDKSISEAEFPFITYRPGQRSLAVNVYNTIKEKKKIFIQAPTGIGKTISTIFPAIKALREKKTDRIFYLTPKSTGKEIGEASVELIRSQGTKLRSITLTSKEKICFMEEVRCEADYCPYAKGYYNRIIEAIIDILENEDSLKRSVIEEYSRKHSVCPFEFSLDLSLYADIIIGDYNYAFDPRVYLKRFFDEKTASNTFLIDEAHNLLDRSREMFSSKVNLQSFVEVSKNMNIENKKIAKKAMDVAQILSNIGERLGKNGREAKSKMDEYLYDGVLKFTQSVSEYLSDETKVNEREDFKKAFKNEWDHLLDTFFNGLSFVRIGEQYTEGHITYSQVEKDDVVQKMFCIDPSTSLVSTYNRADSIVFFSATLSPMDYYRSIYGASEEDYNMTLPSPFPKENISVFLDTNINTRYKVREDSYEKIADNLNIMVEGKKGNYIAFFPSYRYMEDVFEVFKEKYEDLFIIEKQESGLKEEERQRIIESFNEVHDKSYLYFMVLGGVFSEGIDLKGESLIGTAIIGLGYPTFDFERELIQEYFDGEKNEGFNYAYTYPGLGKITQGGGRVIRTKEDKGIIFLMDDRYRNLNIRRLLPENWFPLMDKDKIVTESPWNKESSLSLKEEVLKEQISTINEDEEV